MSIEEQIKHAITTAHSRWAEIYYGPKISVSADSAEKELEHYEKLMKIYESKREWIDKINEYGAWEIEDVELLEVFRFLGFTIEKEGFNDNDGSYVLLSKQGKDSLLPSGSKMSIIYMVYDPKRWEWEKAA